MFDKKLSPHCVSKVLLVLQLVCLLVAFIAGFKAIRLEGSAQLAKITISYLGFVVFIVIDLYRNNWFPWIR